MKVALHKFEAPNILLWGSNASLPQWNLRKSKVIFVGFCLYIQEFTHYMTYLKKISLCGII